nr:hypothetical protein [Orientia tsutsugamushi]
MVLLIEKATTPFNVSARAYLDCPYKYAFLTSYRVFTIELTPPSLATPPAIQ